jgi:hypothetical protein
MPGQVLTGIITATSFRIRLFLLGPPAQRAAIDATVGQLRSFSLKLESSGSHIVYVNEKL